MHALSIDWNPSKRQLRHFAWLAALLLAVLAWCLTAYAEAWTLRLAAAALFAIGTVLPAILRWPYVALFLLAYAAVWFYSHGLLPFVAWSGTAALALCYRLLGRATQPQATSSCRAAATNAERSFPS